MRQEQSDDGDTSLLEGALQCTLDSLRHYLGRSRPASLEKAFEGPLPLLPWLRPPPRPLPGPRAHTSCPAAPSSDRHDPSAPPASPAEALREAVD